MEDGCEVPTFSETSGAAWYEDVGPWAQFTGDARKTVSTSNTTLRRPSAKENLFR